MADWHLKDYMLAAYAVGSLSEGMTLLAAAHLTYCAACRAVVRDFEVLAGAVLAEAEACSPPDLANVLAMIDAPGDPTTGRPGAAPVSDPSLPRPLRDRLGAPLDDLRWRFLMPGLSEHRLDGFGDERVSLLRARPGVRIPGHTHSGEEATLILTGQLRDGDRVFSRGDVSLADHADDHTPEIIGEETCVCLAVLSGRMRFTGLLGPALNLFAR